MIGYGRLVLQAAKSYSRSVREIRAASCVSKHQFTNQKANKIARNVDRFGTTSLTIAGKRADIIHVVDPGNVVYLPILRKQYSVCTVHDMIPFLLRSGELSGANISRFGSLLMDRMLRELERVDRIVCISEATRQDLQRFISVDPDRISLIPNAVFQNVRPAAQNDVDSFRRLLGIPPGVPLIGHIGKNFYKNRERVIQAFVALRRRGSNARLLMVGALDAKLQRVASQCGYADAIHTIERLPRAQMSNFYSSLDVLFFPSLYEGFGLPVLEARLCNTQVVCSDRGALPEAGGRWPYFVDPFDIPGMADALESALSCEKIDKTKAYKAFGLGLSREAWCREHHLLYSDLTTRRSCTAQKD